MRPSTPADVPAAAAIWHREETAWLGSAQQSVQVMAVCIGLSATRTWLVLAPAAPPA